MRKNDQKAGNSRQRTEFNNLFLALAIITLAILGAVQIKPVHAQGKMVTDDSKGVVLGAQVARSAKEKSSLLPVENYFGDPHWLTLEAQLKAQKVVVYAQDEVTVFPDPRLGIGSVIRVTRATPVIIKDGNQSALYRTWTSTVQGLLAEYGVELGQDDKISPVLDAQLSPDLTLTITRVEITKITQTESIQYQTQTQDDPTMDRGTTQIKEVGQNGVRTKTYEVRRENGQEVSRKLIDNQVVKSPQNQIIVRGTKVVLLGQGIATWFSAPPLTAASNTLPRGTPVLVTNTSNGQSVQVTIIGGGIQGSAIIDLSPDAFAQLSPLDTGVIPVKLTKP